MAGWLSLPPESQPVFPFLPRIQGLHAMRRRRASLLAEIWKLLVLLVTVRIITRYVRAGRGRGLGWR